MAKTKFESVDAYLAAQPEAVRPILERVRATLRKALPKVQEVISYQMPTYRIPEGVVVYFAGWKEHYSLYPAIGKLVATFQEELAPYEVTKGTIRFPLDKPVPARLITALAKFRAAEVMERAAAKVAVKKASRKRSAKRAVPLQSR